MIAQNFAHDANGRISDRPARTSIVFTAHNRKDLVLRAIDLALKQTVPVHIIIADDASSDGTQEAVLAAYPDISYLRSEVSRGPCYQRNEGVKLATTEIVFPLDDDSMLVEPEILEEALADFAAPSVAIVCMPFQNILQDTQIRHARREGQPFEMLDFAACAHGVRRDAFLQVGGYNEELFYSMEEGDLALRLLDRQGLRTIRGTSRPLHHMQVPKKRSYIQDFTMHRNKIIFYYKYAPGLLAPYRMVGSVAVGLKFAWNKKFLRPWFWGVLDGFARVLKGKVKRQPVSKASFEMYARLRRVYNG